MADKNLNQQSDDLKKLESQAEADEFVPSATSAPVPVKAPSQAAQQFAGYVVMGVSVVCGVMASKRGAHWVLTEVETSELHLSVARVAEKYVSIDLNNPLYALAATVGAILVPRVAVEFMQSDKKPVERPIDGDKSKHEVAE